MAMLNDFKHGMSQEKAHGLKNVPPIKTSIEAIIVRFPQQGDSWPKRWNLSAVCFKCFAIKGVQILFLITDDRGIIGPE
jgi:hypothetical protein